MSKKKYKNETLLIKDWSILFVKKVKRKYLFLYNLIFDWYLKIFFYLLNNYANQYT